MVISKLNVDDPYGRVSDFAASEAGGSGYTGTKNAPESGSFIGEENLWSWSNISETVIKYACAFVEQKCNYSPPSLTEAIKCKR